MKLNFCTLFDSNYMTRGLAMHQSLVQNCSSFHLYIFAFDSISIDILNKLKLPNVTIISLTEFEDEALLNVKPTRSAAEYCWTCTPATILYCINTYQLDHCTYIDADLIFYSNPQVLIDEMGDKSVLITEHRYTPKYDYSATSGKYCVQFMCFKNDEDGITALKWWRDACLDWCYDLYENGRFGDQKYLDDWTTRFKGVHELKHIGGGVAPWNVQQYQFKKVNNKYYLKEKKGNEEYKELVFYHFHAIKFYLNDIVRLSPIYYLSDRVITFFYFPYIKELMKQKTLIKKVTPSFNTDKVLDISPRQPYTLKDKIHLYKSAILRGDIFKFSSIKETIIENYFYYLNSII